MNALKKKVLDDLTRHGRVYEVGGCVRDTLMGLGVEAKDRDYLVTGIPIDNLVELLRPHGRVDLVGKSFGVLKFTAHSNGTGPYPTVDIALPRREFSTGVAHTDFHVDFDHTLPIERDLERRDFTINAIAMDLSENRVIDPLGGRSDIDRRILRMIAESSFTDDPLRILRGVQFVARFGLEIEPRTLEAMRRHAELIRTVTYERISEELNKLLERSEKPSVGFLLMHEIGLLAHIVPELEETVGITQPGGYHAYNVFEHLLATVDAAPCNLKLRWAALLHDVTKPQSRRLEEEKATFYGHEASGARIAKKILTRLRYSNDFIRDVSILVERHMFSIPPTDKGLRRLVRRTGTELIFDLLDLRRADVVGQGMGNPTDDVDEFEKRIREELERKPPFSVADLDIGGREIMSIFGIPESPLVGRILNMLLEIVLDEPEKNKKDILIDAARDYLNSEENR